MHAYHECLGIDLKGELWQCDNDNWLKIGRLPIQKATQIHIDNQYIRVIDLNGQKIFTRAGELVSQRFNVALQTADGHWLMMDDNVVTYQNRFVRVLPVPALHMVSEGDLCFVSMGTVLLGFDEENERMHYQFAEPIVALGICKQLLVVALGNRMLHVFHTSMFSLWGSYRSDGKIVDVDVTDNFHVLVRYEGGGVELLFLDGIQR